MSINLFKNKLCINLDRRPDRWESVSEEFKNYGVENVIRISGCDGQNLGLPLRREHAGELGSSISHLNAIKYAKEHNFDNVLIFEDDVKFHPQINNFIQPILNNLLEDWDMLYFGGNHQYPIGRVNDFIGRTTRTFALQMYCVNSKCYDRLIELLEQENNKAMNHDMNSSFVSLAGDFHIANIQYSINVYVTLMKLSYQSEGFSDIQFTNVDYDCLKR